MPALPAAPPTLRPITDDDLDFLSSVYASTRKEELAPVPWTDEQKRTFLQMQFNAQHQYYQDEYPDGDYSIIVHNGTDAGRLYVDRRVDEIRLIDIALLPAFRGLGMGRTLLQALIQEGTERGLPIRLHVEPNNPARRLYERLGFQFVEDRGVYAFMEWRPPSD